MFLLVIFSCVILLYFIDKRVDYILEKYINIEVEKFTNNVVNETVNDVISEYNLGDYLKYNRNEFKEFKGISYKTTEINKITDKVSDTVSKRLNDIENGDIEEFNYSGKRYKNIKNGLLCDISFASIRGSVLFANVGPTIPIKLTFMGHVNSELDVKTTEYGINNILIQIDLIITVKEVSSMPLTSKEQNIVVKVPISIDIINGEIPDYYTGKM